MPSQVENFGEMADGPVHRVTLRGGITVEVLSYGAVIQRIEAPDRAGTPVDVALGFETVQEYVRAGHFGAAVGRYAGRIGGARFVLDGHTYDLPKNEGPNCLHGGVRGFGKRLWRIESAQTDAVVLAYTSADGEEGFPGTLDTRLTYTVSGSTLQIRYEARTDRPTVLNVTNHSYFNLAGEGAGSVLDHILQVESDAVLEVDAAAIPTGTMLEVGGTPFDFRMPHAIGERIRVPHPQILAMLGYDQCFVLRGAGMRRGATVYHERTGRRLEVWTDEPAVQVYTANKFTGALYGASGRTYRSGDGLALETQHFPDSPNHPQFPSAVLRPGDVFRSATDLVFLAE